MSIHTVPEAPGSVPGGHSGKRRDAGQEWADFTTAQSAAEFCQAWLSIQCRAVPDAVAGLLLLEEEHLGRFAPAAIWPERTVDVTHLADVAQQSMRQQRGLLVEPKEAGRGPQVAYPISVKDRLQGVIVLELRPTAKSVQDVMRLLHWGAAWIEVLFLRRRIGLDDSRMGRTRLVLDILAGAGEHEDLHSAAFAVINDITERFECRRTALGMVRQRGIKMLAISHTAWFRKSSEEVATIENAMEEALDQEASISLPSSQLTDRRIALAHRDLMRHSAARAVLSVPVVSAGQTVGMLTLERDVDKRFNDGDVETLEAVGALLGPVLVARKKAERMIAGRIADAIGGFFGGLFGKGKLALKLLVVALALGVASLAFVQADFRVSTRVVVEGETQQAATAPFDGFVVQAPVRAGDVVAAGAVLARMDDREFALEAIRWRSERDQQVLKYDDALGQHDRPAAQIAAAMIRQAEAQLALAEDKVMRSVLTAPYDGTIISGDLSQRLGTPVEKGTVLFEIAPVDSYRVILEVDERDLAFVSVGDIGELVVTSLTGRTFQVRVARITPVSTAEEGRNYFRVEAELVGSSDGLRNGMEGVAKVTVDRTNLLQVWARPVIDWARYQFWAWTP